MVCLWVRQGAYPSMEHLNKPGTHTLAFYKNPYITDKNIGPRCQPLKTFLSSSSLVARAESKLACLSTATFFRDCLFINNGSLIR
jgi:hypothetical protein